MHDTINLLSIPNEILGQIFDAVQERASLETAARTCHALRDFAEARLYSHLSLEKRETLEALGKLVEARPQKARFVRRLDLVFSTVRYDNNLVGVTTADAVTTFPNLKSLTVESPRCNARSRGNPSDWGTDWPADMVLYLRLFESASLLSEPSGKDGPLQNLTSCQFTCPFWISTRARLWTDIALVTLHWSGAKDRFWYTTPSCPVFLLPNLEKLEMSCVVMEATEGDQELSRFEGKTNLKTLVFTQSVIHSDSLNLLLKLPKELCCLEVYEVAQHPITARMMSVIRSRDQLIRLSNNSLRQLTLSMRPHPLLSGAYLQPLQLDLSGLPSLESLQVGPHSSRSQDRWALVGQLPRNLALLRLAEFEHRLLARHDSILSDLRIGEVCSNRGAQGWGMAIDLATFRVSPYRHEAHRPPKMRNNIRSFEQSALELQPSRESPLELRITTARATSFIMPYLYREKRPQRVVRYISTRPDDDQFLARPYFERTGIPEDEADLQDQDNDMVEVFASEKVSQPLLSTTT
ncbi:hypothetical protein PG994_007307 [Apiospora phragmitis]|uniref:F-box domain-containing protein n=1 Tax=Apiospora phragmitis TaxID=2905665 RepID=A0ABR1V3L4_9PEZI